MMQIPNRDAVALSARTLGALFSYTPNSEQNAPLVAAFLDGSWQPQWPFPVSDSLAMEFTASSDEALPQAGSVCLSVHGRFPLRRGVRCGWIKSRCYSATQRLRCASGYAPTVSLWILNATNQKTTLAPCCCWPHGCAKQIRMSYLRNCWLASTAVVRAFPERIYGKRRASVLSGAGPTGAVDAG